MPTSPEKQVEKEVREQLAQVYKPKGVEIWMASPHKLLHTEVPADLIHRGEGDRVLAVATQLADGSYA